MKHRLPALLALLGLATVARAAPPAPLLLWDFNEGGGAYASNHGSAGHADLYLLAPGGDAADAFSSASQGVSGKSGDHAFDLTTATGMGATTPNSTGPAGVVWSNSSGLTSLSGLSSFTLSGWIKPAVPVNNAARIVASRAIALMAGVENRLTLQVNGENADEQSEPLYQEVGSWIFFAVSYDGTRNVGNVTYYVGSAADGSLTQAGVTTIPAGKLKPFAGQFIIGNNSSNSPTTRPFKGMIDNLALHASKDDGSGALSRDEIEAIRAAAVR